MQGNKTKVRGRGEEVVHAYDSLLTKTRELAELAGALGGSSGELLLDECAAKVCWSCHLTSSLVY